MKDLHARTAFAIALVLLASTACGGGGGVPSASSALRPASVRIGDGAAARNLSGQYAGKVKDNVYGTGRATASLAQYKSTLGGSETIAFGSGSVKDSLALNLTGTALNGATVASSRKALCSFSTTAAYNTKTHILTGSYYAVNRCSGEKGTYALKHQCLYKGAGDDDIRPESGLKPC
ncbi:MAG TPA: hypothetical protein VIX60_05090 [Candidatus Cybelea sp.]